MRVALGFGAGRLGVSHNACMTRPARHVFWTRTKVLTLTLLLVWLLANLLLPWSARALNSHRWLGFPLGYWLLAEGALLLYLLITLAYVWGMDRLEAEGVDDTAPTLDPGAEGAGPA